MPTPSGVVAGIDVIFSVDGVPVGCARSSSLSVSREVLEASCKESGGSREITLGEMSWTMSTENIMKIGSDVSWEDFFGFINTKQKIDITFGTNVTGDKVFTGEVFVTSYTLDASADDVASFSAEMEGTGPLTLTTLSASLPVTP